MLTNQSQNWRQNLVSSDGTPTLQVTGQYKIQLNYLTLSDDHSNSKLYIQDQINLPDSNTISRYSTSYYSHTDSNPRRNLQSATGLDMPYFGIRNDTLFLIINYYDLKKGDHLTNKYVVSNFLYDCWITLFFRMKRVDNTIMVDGGLITPDGSLVYKSVVLNNADFKLIMINTNYSLTEGDLKRHMRSYIIDNSFIDLVKLKLKTGSSLVPISLYTDYCMTPPSNPGETFWSTIANCKCSPSCSECLNNNECTIVDSGNSSICKSGYYLFNNSVCIPKSISGPYIKYIVGPMIGVCFIVFTILLVVLLIKLRNARNKCFDISKAPSTAEMDVVTALK